MGVLHSYKKTIARNYLISNFFSYLHVHQTNKYHLHMELVTYPTLANSICETRSRKIKQTFFTQINTLLNWQPMIKVLKQHYRKGKSATGKPSYSGYCFFL